MEPVCSKALNNPKSDNYLADYEAQTLKFPYPLYNLWNLFQLLGLIEKGLGYLM